MKATELMIGNWVAQKHSGLLLKVSEVRPPYIIANGEDGQFHEDTLEPIPLTAEILEQNGFGRVPQPGCFNPYHWKLEKRDEDGELLYRIEAYNTPFRGMFIQINNLSDCAGCLFRKQIEHFHELQQALRLCNIDTKIIIKED
jgi:hypothetical protein